MYRALTILSFIYLSRHVSLAQKITTLSTGFHRDSSFYFILKVSENAFWVSGENGILKEVDTTGQIKNINCNCKGYNILKMVRKEPYVFLFTGQGVIYRYNMVTRQCISKTFKKLRRKSIYAAISTKDGTLYMGGGTQGVAVGKKQIPRGYLAKSDTSLQNLKILRKYPLRFIWAIAQTDTQTVEIAGFNGLNTVIWKMQTNNKRYRKNKMQALIHEINAINGYTWYCGSKTYNYKNKGFLAKDTYQIQDTLLGQTACVWGLRKANDGLIIGLTQRGMLYALNTLTGTRNIIKMPHSDTLYDMIPMTRNVFLVVGHGKRMYQVEF